MSASWAYDLDGVLAEIAPELPPQLQQKWGRMNGAQRRARTEAYLWAYDRAKPLYDPPQAQFDVVTARKEDPATRAVTEQWLHQHFPGRVRRLAMLTEGRRIDVVVPYKARHLAAWGTTDFAEDNRKVVAGLRRLGGAARIWLYCDGILTLPAPKNA